MNIDSKSILGRTRMFRQLGAALLATLCGGCPLGGSGRRMEVSFDAAHTSDRVVFSAPGPNGGHLYLLDIASRRRQRFGASPIAGVDPSYSPDDSEIAFAVPDGNRGPDHIYVADAAGVRIRRLTSGNGCFDRSPCFTPDGKRIVFWRSTYERPYSMGGMTWDDWDLFSMKSDGSDLRRITHRAYYSGFPPWCLHDRRSLIYAAYPHTGGNGSPTDIMRVPIDGSSDPVRLTTDGHSFDGVISPTGTSIAYVSDRSHDFDYEIWSMSASGEAQRQLTRAHSYIVGPRYQRDGRHIMYLSDPGRSSQYELWQLDVATGASKKILDWPELREPITAPAR